MKKTSIILSFGIALALAACTNSSKPAADSDTGVVVNDETQITVTEEPAVTPVAAGQVVTAAELTPEEKTALEQAGVKPDAEGNYTLTEQAATTLNDWRTKAAETVNNAADAVGDAVGQVKDAAGNAVGTVKDAANEAAAKAGEVVDNAKQTVESAKQTVEDAKQKVEEAKDKAEAIKNAFNK